MTAQIDSNLCKINHSPQTKQRRLLQKRMNSNLNERPKVNKQLEKPNIVPQKPNNMSFQNFFNFFKDFYSTISLNSQKITLLPVQSTQNTGKPTLILDLDKTLIYSSIHPVDRHDFTIKFGPNPNQEYEVYVQKRPFLDLFLEKCSALFEIVVFTASIQNYAEPILDRLDPQRKFFQHRLYRETCLVIFGNYIKDLSRMNRNLNSIVIVDDMPLSYCLHPQNGIHIEPFVAVDNSDNELMRVLAILSRISKERDLIHALGQFRKSEKNPDFFPILPQKNHVESKNAKSLKRKKLLL
ncbi:nli interacting factor-like phosphatase family protein [Anaeramoeba flamelloides]|uniref:Nli interacting factor-like phosphatase family protein n=1 Tax=Anaeramoeba flamelloides TaxID=1746091 RepID=A0ABQ8YD20_9EUKA|nr:nli interacting factor-like phosphatase family protein [Anaeramoeba flamelloides]